MDDGRKNTSCASSSIVYGLSSIVHAVMSPKELATHYKAKVFDTKEAAEAAGFVLTETHAPRNIWNKASAAQAVMHKLLARRASGEATEIGLVLENYSLTGCYKAQESEVRSQESE